jgi:hypothetical protein
MIYLILKERTYSNIPSDFTIVDNTKDIDIAEDKLRGYNLINTEKNVVYSILRYESPLILKKVA